MIKHRGCDKHVRERVSDDPGLVGHSHKVREVVYLACLKALPFQRPSVVVILPKTHTINTTAAIETSYV
jgi:hypothetical protein